MVAVRWLTGSVVRTSEPLILLMS